MNRLQTRATLSGSVVALALVLLCASAARADGQASFLIFQTPPGARSAFVSAISGDGSVVVGSTDTNSNQKAIRYMPSAGAGAFEYLASTQQPTKATDI